MTTDPAATLRIICTDHGTHGPRDLGYVHWTPPLKPKGFAIWDAGTDPATLAPETLVETGRTTAAGKWRTTARTTVTRTTRADGGTTFHFPSCPTCHAPARSLRDDTLVRMIAAGRRVVDISAIP